jgi:NAD(P)-dependent dehydrogenase (short-subunit alcohol dehydrogenase family)
MDLRGRTVLLCGGATPLDAALVRELRRSRAELIVHGIPDPGDGASARMSGGRRAVHPVSVEGDASSAAGSAGVLDRAWRIRGRLDAVVLHPALAPLPADLRAEDDDWRALLDSGLKRPFFLAREAGLRMAPAGGRLIFVAESVPEGSAADLATGVVCAGLVTMAEALARALPPAAAVSTVVVGRPTGSQSARHALVSEAARAVCFLLADAPRSSGTIVEIGAVSFARRREV